MKNIKTILIVFVFSIFSNSCVAQENLDRLDFLIGTWKMENKDTYESWKQVHAMEFKGESYKNVKGKKRIMETLSIKIMDGSIVYEANVPGQNNGKTIVFPLNTDHTELISFENLNHDFPKKIQYKNQGDEKILVNVLGNDDKGFSYYLTKEDQ